MRKDLGMCHPYQVTQQRPLANPLRIVTMGMYVDS